MAIPLGAGGSASYPTIFLSKSQTWVPPQDGNICIHVIGAGGSGAVRNGNTSLSSGAAGGYCRKNSLAVTTSGSFTVVIGAGGASVGGSNLTGNLGGTTTFSGTGLSSTLTANGGSGGQHATSATSGGTASGGDVNNTGGAGGNQKGGGAVGLTGTGNAGTSISSVVYAGGECDIVGDFWASSLGQIAGGKRGMGAYCYTVLGLGVVEGIDAGPLSGGGSMYSDSGTNSSTPAGNACIGGGGGYCLQQSSEAYAASGRGGEGIVVIQYIP